MLVLLKKSLFEGLEESDPTLLDAFQPRSSIKRLMLKPKAATPISGQDTTQSPAAVPGQTEMLEADKENKDVLQTSVILPEKPEDSWYVFLNCFIASTVTLSMNFFKFGVTQHGLMP